MVNTVEEFLIPILSHNMYHNNLTHLTYKNIGVNKPDIILLQIVNSFCKNN